MPEGPAVLCIGHLTVDLITVVDEAPREEERILASDGVLASGGPAATAAVALARLGVPSAFLGISLRIFLLKPRRPMFLM